MISIEEALHRIYTQQVNPVAIEKPLLEAGGFYLAESIHAPFDLPDFDNSAMDGYAVCGLSDNYTIVGEVAAGDTLISKLNEGEAMRIFTGGKIPENTTAVVMQEKTEVDNDNLKITAEIKPGQHIRPKGGELATGQLVFDSAHLISPASVGLIRSLGIEFVKVFQKPVVGLIVTGNELIDPGQHRMPGQIYESNSISITAALEKFGYSCAEKLKVEDDYEKTRDAIGDFLDKTDLLLLSGGISVGDYDYVKKALLENGVEEIFYKVFQKPGKPLFFGKKGSKYVFALPGNPASSLTCFYIYLLPMLQKMSGAFEYGLPQMPLPLAHNYQMSGDRPAFLKAKIAGQKVTILDGQGSSMLHTMALGNALVFLQPGSDLKSGDMVQCFFI